MVLQIKFVQVFNLFNRDLFKKDFVCVCRFDNGSLIIVVMDLKGNIYKTIKCEDETVLNYFYEVFL